MKTFKLLFLFLSITSFAQSKVGTVDIDYILSKMPELSSVQAEIETYGKGLDVDLNKKVDAYKALIETYKASEASLSEDQKKQKQQELVTAETDLNKFQQNGNQLINIKRDELLRPLYSKIGESLEKISKAENFTQVFQIDNSIVYIDPTLDITIKILKDLGIEVKEEN
ncbi:OmpH family outer membrane protein [Ulvibacter litoralis]|uniref:Outer membrane protein n=1 Tax=Ulvibacter litoralis TaxID=227084 RepID=A0A1G7GYS5_9FLAO|nr:OmpH family outer membrane protein [Ulvibacter litoralis]GHC59619.1 hypothetical protein GCM10008083_25650 [Ulvibacter litoralis]SDE93265.1 outer membrane protein [Ulvibacter litoralis]